MKKVILLIELTVLAIYGQAQLYSYDGYTVKKATPSAASSETPLNKATNKAAGIRNGNEKEEVKYNEKRKKWISLIPVKNKTEAIAYFENSDTLVHETNKEGAFQFEHSYLNYLSRTKSFAAYTEPTHGFIAPVRLSLGLMALAPSSKDSANQTDSAFNKQRFMDRFRSSGGNAILTASFPLLRIHDDSGYIDLKSYAVTRFCIDVPREDTTLQRFAHNTQFGIETQLKISSKNEEMKLLLCHKYSAILGNSTFYDNMGFTGSGRKKFDFNTWTVGFVAKGVLALYYTWYTGSGRAINPVPQNNSLTVNYTF